LPFAPTFFASDSLVRILVADGNLKSLRREKMSEALIPSCPRQTCLGLMSALGQKPMWLDQRGCPLSAKKQTGRLPDPVDVLVLLQSRRPPLKEKAQHFSGCVWTLRIRVCAVWNTSSGAAAGRVLSENCGYLRHLFRLPLCTVGVPEQHRPNPYPGSDEGEDER
jgi:hypothetical protein